MFEIVAVLANECCSGHMRKPKCTGHTTLQQLHFGMLQSGAEEKRSPYRQEITSSNDALTICGQKLESKIGYALREGWHTLSPLVVRP